MASSSAIKDARIVIEFLELLDACGYRKPPARRAWLRARFRRDSIDDMTRAEVLRAIDLLKQEKGLGIQ